jgi:hypothetical protein
VVLQQGWLRSEFRLDFTLPPISPHAAWPVFSEADVTLGIRTHPAFKRARLAGFITLRDPGI